MLMEQIVVGTRVKCVFMSSFSLDRDRNGKVGTIDRVDVSGRMRHYWIKWDDGYNDGEAWGSPRSFELLDPAEEERIADRNRREKFAMQYL